MFYVTFDPYYGQREYTKFLNSARNNGVVFSEWINVRPPYNWYVKINVQDMPKFVDFDVAKTQQETYMIKVIAPLVAQDELPLKRRDSDTSTNFERFVVNDMWKEVNEAQSLLFFKYKTKEQLMAITKMPEMKDTKVYLSGKVREWYTAITTNQFVRGLIPQGDFLYSITNNAIFEQPGELEYFLNAKIIRTDKLHKKNTRTDYYMNGRYYPVVQSASTTKLHN